MTTATTTIGTEKHVYRFDDTWAKLPRHIQPGYTHGVTVDRQGRVIVFNQSPHGVLMFDGEGRFIKTWDAMPSERFVGAHGLTRVEQGGEEYLWLTDQTSTEVVKTTLDGETVLSIEKPDHPAYAEGKYIPTWATESPVDGTIYVADGYGQGLIHRYDRDGRYIDSLDGTTGAGRFKCPHGIWIGARPAATGRDEPVLYVTDRGNGRVQVFGLDGTFIKSFDQKHPCCFDEHDGELLVPDLHAFVNIYDERDELVAEHLGDNREIVGQHGWPNVPGEHLQPGRFNSPHGGCFDRQGNIYIVEWISHGRIIKLTRDA
ncbi:MAG: hypothetical protein WD009_10720 [Phycisphaeraceae bacterium]